MAQFSRTDRRTAVLIALTALLASTPGVTIAQPSAVLEFGADPDAIALLERHAVDPTYVQLWAGAWLHRDGWSGFEKALNTTHQSGRTPVIQFFYWGNDLNEACFRDGCDAHGNLRKDQAGWDRLTAGLIERLNTEFQGDPIVIVLETEFNKAMRHSEDLDAALAAKADQLRRGYGGATVVLGFGNWGQDDWRVFDRAAKASDEVGLQLMRGTGRDTPDQIRQAPDQLLASARTARELFHKPLFVSDIAFSSHGGPDFEDAQADAIRRLFQLAPQLQEVGVHAIVYRSILDNPSADTSDYYGEAERHFGLVWTENRTAKPAFSELVRGLEQLGKPPAPGPTQPSDDPTDARDAVSWLGGFPLPAEDEPAQRLAPSPKITIDEWANSIILPNAP